MVSATNIVTVDCKRKTTSNVALGNLSKLFTNGRHPYWSNMLHLCRSIFVPVLWCLRAGRRVGSIRSTLGHTILCTVERAGRLLRKENCQHSKPCPLGVHCGHLLLAVSSSFWSWSFFFSQCLCLQPFWTHFVLFPDCYPADRQTGRRSPNLFTFLSNIPKGWNK